MMRIIITGGTGLIGRALAELMAPGGHEIILLSRSPGRVGGLPAGVRAEGWDGRSAVGWGSLVDGAQAIVNLAGENLSGGRWTAERKRRIRESRLMAGAAVVEAVQAAKRKPAVVIQSSGIGIYGPHDSGLLTEDSPAGAGFLAQLAVEWEACTAPVEGWGVRRAIIRTSPVLSLRGGALPLQMLPFRFFVGGPIGSGRQPYPWIHIADEVRAIRFLIEHPSASGPFNLMAPEATTNAQFARALGRAMGRPALIPVPAFALRLLFGEMADMLLTGQWGAPDKLLDLGFTFLYPEIEGALRHLLRAKGAEV